MRGKHIIKAGGQYEANQDNGGNWGDTNAATMAFSGVFTAKAPFSTGSGVGYADFLTGQVDNWNAFISPWMDLRNEGRAVLCSGRLQDQAQPHAEPGVSATRFRADGAK